jgi:hypothetical protein
VYVRIACDEADLRDRAKRLGAIWRKEQRLWEITFRDSKRLGIVDRIAETVEEHPSSDRYAPTYSAIHK